MAPALGVDESGDAAQRGGFAATARTEQREQLAAARIQASDVRGDDGAVVLAQALDGQEGVVGRLLGGGR